MDKIKSSKNIKKRILGIFLWGLMVLLYIPLSLSYLSNQPLFQTFSARMATMVLSDMTGYNLSVNSIHISLFNGIEAGGLSLYDKHGNPMMMVGKLKAVPVYADWKILGVLLHEVKLDSVDFRLGSYQKNEPLNFMKFINSFSSDTTKTKTSESFKLKIKKLTLTNTHFELFNKYDSATSSKTMDYSNMVYDNINLYATHFSLHNDSLNFIIKQLSADEKCGLKVYNLSTHLILSGTTIETSNLQAHLNHSFIDADLSLKYKSWGSMSYFLDSVQLYANLRKDTKINLADIGYFAEVMFPMQNLIKIKGVVKGTVNDLNCKNIDLLYGDRTKFKGDISIKDVTTFDQTIFQANIEQLQTSICDIQHFQLPDSSHIELPNNFKCQDVFNLSGEFVGNYFNFYSNLNVKTGASSINGTLSLLYKNNDTVRFHTNLKGYLDEAGHLLNLPNIFEKSKFEILAKGSGKNFRQLHGNTTIKLSQTTLMNYEYDSIFLNGFFSGQAVAGQVVVRDRNLNLSSNFKINLSETPEYQADLNLQKAHFKPLKLFNHDFSLVTKCAVYVKGHSLDDLIVHLKADSSVLQFKNQTYRLKKLKLDKYDSLNLQYLTLHSDFINAKVNGHFLYSELNKNLTRFIETYLNKNQLSTIQNIQSENIHVSLQVKDDRLLSEQFLEGTRIAPKTVIDGFIDFKTDSSNIVLKSPMIKKNDLRFKNDTLSIRTFDQTLFVDLHTQALILKDSTSSDPSKIGLEQFKLAASIAHGVLGFKINWNNLSDTTTINKGKIQGYYFQKDDNKTISFDDVAIYTNDTLWTIDKNNKIVLDSTGIRFENFSIRGGKSSALTINGVLPKKLNDSISITFSQWDLTNFNPLIKNTGFSLSGTLNGIVEASLPDSNLAVISDIKVEDFGFNKVYFGYLRMMNTWDNVNKSVFIKSQIIRKGNKGVGQIFSLEGFYYPLKDTNSLNLSTHFNRLNIAFLNPILKDLFHQIKGKANGSFTINGSLTHPVLIGKVKLERTSLVINYLNTKYSFSNYLTFDHDKINFNNIVIYDTLGNSARVKGNITHQFFSDFNYDFHINTKKLLFVNTNRRLNDLYYGTAIASGDIHMWGSPDQLNLNIDTKTAEGTNLSIPLDQVYSTADNEYIHFIPPPIDSLSLKQKENEPFTEEPTEVEMQYHIDIKANITPEAQVNIYLPADLGKIESKGHGNLNLKTSSNGEFVMIGDYIVDRGNFNFNFKNLISKRFDIVPGGKITWTGDPTGAYMNIVGLYKVKVSLSSLGIVIDSTADYKNKQTVNCYITLKNKLLNPDIKFSIDLPDADPDIKRMVFANLDTTNPAMVNEQMISLLVFGSFSFNNATNMSVASQGYNILTNQLSSMLSKISNNVDIGMNYRPGDDISKQEFEVALSTQLFNDRLIIDGNVGMTYDRGQKNASNIVGDVDILYKLTKDGRWLLKAFNHSNANSWYYYNNYDKISPYTQGVGIAYRKEFNNIAELFRSRKNKKKKTKKPDKL